MAFERYVNQGGKSVNQAKYWVIGIIALLVLIIIWNGFVTVPAGHKGVVLRFGAVRGSMNPGLHLLVPFVDKVIVMNVQEVIYEFQANTFSEQQQDVFMDVVIRYKINRDYVEYLYETFGTVNNIIESVIEPSSNQSVKAVTSQFDTTKIHTSRENIRQKVEEKLNDTTVYAIVWEISNKGSRQKFLNILSENDKMVDTQADPVEMRTIKGIQREVYIADKKEGKETVYFLDNIVSFTDVNITNIEYSDAYTQSIEDKQIAQQRVEKADRELEEAKTRKEIAKTEAEAKKIEQELISASLTPLILQNRWIDKWNGILPTVMGGESGGLILDIGSFENGK
jgi:prohibitin 2